MSLFYCKPGLIRDGLKKENPKNESKTKKIKNKNHNKKKQEQKKLLRPENSNKQTEEEKEVKSQQEIVQLKICNLLKNTLSRYQHNILLCSLKFIYTPKDNIIQLKSDIHNYSR